MPQAQIKLRQTKMYVGPLRFGVRHEIVSATPALLTNAFVVDLSAAAQDKERFVRVATLETSSPGASRWGSLGASGDVAGRGPSPPWASATLTDRLTL